MHSFHCFLMKIVFLKPVTQIISQFLLCRRGLILISLERWQSRHSKSATNSSSVSVASARKGRDTCLRFEADNSVELDQDAWFAIPVPKGRIIYSRTVFQPFTFEFADLLLALGIIIWSSLFVISRYFCSRWGNEKTTICNMICLSGTYASLCSLVSPLAQTGK